MKFSHSWLTRYLDTTATPTDITKALISLGLEVERLDDPRTRLKGFVYGKVVHCGKHPNADRLSVCDVDIGADTPLVQVVCGAPNVHADMGVVFAAVGVTIPVSGEPLKKGVIRGVESNGMLCSERELLIGDVHQDGIMDLGLEHAPGTPIIEILAINAIYELSITPNRGDCFSVYGIARDLAAFGIGRLKSFPNTKFEEKQCINPEIIIKTPLCKKFALRRIENVDNANLLDIKNLLIAAGQKSINALVDITNYMCLGYGRPMHVFDADKVKGNIIIRTAKSGERFTGLDDRNYTLDEGILVIADDTGIISLAGIMGGKNTAVDSDTKNVLLESAVFDAVSIAMTGQKLNIISDSRMRFERGVDEALVEPCLDLAAHMIVNTCGGEIGQKTIVGEKTYSAVTINFDPQLIANRLGLAVDKKEALTFLERLGCRVQQQEEKFLVTVPSWRHDLHIPEDLVEEVARLKGYEHIQPVSLPLRPVFVASRIGVKLREHFIQRGFLETINWSFIDEKAAKAFSDKESDLIYLDNPISEELNVMRPSLLPSLLKIAQQNIASARYNGAVFEIAPIHLKTYSNYQSYNIAGIRFGLNHNKHWLSSSRPVDVFDCKADVFSVLNLLGINESALQIYAEGPNYYHPGRKGTLKQGNKIIAYFGELHPSLGYEFTAVGFEILENIPAYKTRKISKNFSVLMPLKRDFAFVLDTSISAQTVVKALEKVDPLIESIDIFDCYQGDKIAVGKKSLGITITLQPKEKTLTEAELTAIQQAVVNAAAKVGAILRV